MGKSPAISHLPQEDSTIGDAPYIGTIDVVISHPHLAPLYIARTGGSGA